MTSALEWENQDAKKEAEKALMPVWMIRRVISELSGRGDNISFLDLIEKVSDAETDKRSSKPLRSDEEIIAEFLPMIEEERRRLKHG